jgi:hypothetical protein
MIKIKRASSQIDYTIPYRVVIDGKVVMELKSGEMRDYSLKEGEHTLKIVSDSFVSEVIKFHSYEGQIIEFECKPEHGESNFSKIGRKLFLGKLGIHLEKKNDFYL